MIDLTKSYKSSISALIGLSLKLLKFGTVIQNFTVAVWLFGCCPNISAASKSLLK